MAIGKRLRFQIFRRDNFACRYCGLTAAAGAVLEVDHVHPKADGGRDIPTNLITACEGCNNGKADIPLNAPTVEDVPQADFQSLLEERQAQASLDPDLSEWVHALDIATAVAWHQGFRAEPPPVRQNWAFSIAFALAVASGQSATEIEAAAFEAGQRQDPDLLAYLPEALAAPAGDVGENREAVLFMECLTPWEQTRMIWRARADMGSHIPNIPELIRAAADQGRKYIEEEGRDGDELNRWLDLLPGNEGSVCRMKATADWDANWQGHRAHSAHECPTEVLELAVSYALGTQVPA